MLPFDTTVSGGWPAKLSCRTGVVSNLPREVPQRVLYSFRQTLCSASNNAKKFPLPF